MDVNKINARYFSKGSAAGALQAFYLDPPPPRQILFPRYISGADKVLDLGRRGGPDNRRIGELAGEVIGTDISEVMVETAQEKIPVLSSGSWTPQSITRMSTLTWSCFHTMAHADLYPEEKRQSSMRTCTGCRKQRQVHFQFLYPLSAHKRFPRC